MYKKYIILTQETFDVLNIKYLMALQFNIDQQ